MGRVTEVIRWVWGLFFASSRLKEEKHEVRQLKKVIKNIKKEEKLEKEERKNLKSIISNLNTLIQMVESQYIEKDGGVVEKIHRRGVLGLKSKLIEIRGMVENVGSIDVRSKGYSVSDEYHMLQQIYSEWAQVKSNLHRTESAQFVERIEGEFSELNIELKEELVLEKEEEKILKKTVAETQIRE